MKAKRNASSLVSSAYKYYPVVIAVLLTTLNAAYYDVPLKFNINDGILHMQDAKLTEQSEERYNLVVDN